MKGLTIKSTAEILGAAFSGEDREISGVSTDSRDIAQGRLFVALTGENFDGHDYVAQALEKGAVRAVVMKPVPGVDEAKLFCVDDTRRALLDIAGLYRRQLPVRVAGITGSVGKTTTKEMTACVAAARYRTLKTRQNLNNEIGLSQMLFELTESHEAAVLEMGMDGPGQIRLLSRAAAPDIGVITNIGLSHLETLGSRENIRDAKLELLEGMADGAALVLNADDDLLWQVEEERLNILFYGIDNARAAVRAHRIKEFSTHTTFEIGYNGKRFDAQIPTMGRHNVYNALAAFCVGIAMDMEPQEAIAALRNYSPAGMRQNIVKHNSFTVVEDCYNASPDSMRAALETLGSIACDGKRIAVLSDMLELGEAAEASHLEIGQVAGVCGADVLLCTGELSRLYIAGAWETGMREMYHYEDRGELFAHLKEIAGPGDVIWVKASRGMKLEEILERIYREC